VYTRSAEDSEVVESLTFTTIAAKPEAVFAVITDYPNYPDFMPHIIESRIIESDGTNQVLFQRVRISKFLRFIFKDRYHVVKNELYLPGGKDSSYRIEWSLDTAATAKAAIGNAIATRLNSGYWEIRGGDDGDHSQLRYYLHTDPGGSIPKAFVNMGTTQSIPDVIRALRERLGLSRMVQGDDG
jgi:hypothetical protein